MNKKFLILLGVSLALNFVFIGYEAGRLVSRPAFPDVPARRPSFVPRDAHNRPDFKGQPFLRDAFKKAVKEHGKEMEAARAAMEKVLKSEPFDTEKFKAAMAETNAARAAIDAAVQENMLKMLSEMTPQERARFADKFTRAGKGMPERPRKPFRHHPPFGDKPLPPPHDGAPLPPPCDDEPLPPPPHHP